MPDMPGTRGLPSGNVTFLFTDVESSTALFRRLGERFVDLLEQHRVVVRSAVAVNEGVEVKTEGDGFFIVFADAVKAVRACLQAQRDLLSRSWPEGAELKVRMGLHCGMAKPTSDGDYVAVAVHRAARIAGAAHGGQVIVSAEVGAAVGDNLPEGASLADRGVFLLKGFDEPERIYQILAPGLPSSFPPLRASPAQSHSLPDVRTSFVGRKSELKVVTDLLTDFRLVGIVGPGGAGKTRLALEIGARVATGFAAGTVLADLTAVTNPSMVASTVAFAFGIRGASGTQAAEAVARELAGRDALLIVDNCEHLLDSARAVVDSLLERAAGLRILATSREPLGLAGEQIHRIKPLDVPTLHAEAVLVAASEAGRLFLQRARLVQPTFAITEDNASAVGSICRLLDGMPLGLELAAGLVSAMPVSAIAARLAARPRHLRSSAPGPSARHATLEETIGWSYQLLTADEKCLLNSLSVCVAGFTLSAAEVIGDADDVVDVLTGLVRKSIVVWDADASRYRLLESVRDFAGTRLAENGLATERARDRHASFYAQSALGAERELSGPRQAHWLDALSPDQENIRNAVIYLQAQGEIELALSVLVALTRFVFIRANMAEWLDLADSLFNRSGTEVAAAVRGRALVSAELLSVYQDTAVARAYGEAAIQTGRQIADHRIIAEATALLAAVSSFRGEPDPELGRQAMELSRELEDPILLGEALLCYGLCVQHEPRLQQQIYEEAISVTRRSGDDLFRYISTANLGIVAYHAGDLDTAVRLTTEAVAIGEQLAYHDPIAHGFLGELLLRKGDVDAASTAMRSALRGAGTSLYQSACAVGSIAGYAAAVGEWHQAAHLYGFKDALIRQIGMAEPPEDVAQHDDDLAVLRERLGPRLEDELQTGSLLTLEQALSIARRVTK